MFNTMTITADDKKGNKGDGINAVLKFMIDVRDFQEKLDVCADAQAIVDNKSKISEYSSMIDKLYASLAEIASTSVRAMREKSSGTPVEPEPKKEERGSDPVIVNAPKIPSM